jgi:hypothetical protein
VLSKTAEPEMNSTLHQLEEELIHSVRGLNARQIQLRSSQDPAGWNICQIVQHLILTYSSTASSMQSRMAKITPRYISRTPLQKAIQFIVLRFGLLPGRRKAPPIVAPPVHAPEPLPAVGDLASSVSDALSSMDHSLDQAEQVFGTSPCNTHFALGPLSVAQWRRFHLVHGRHHIRQIIEIRRQHHL